MMIQCQNIQKYYGAELVLSQVTLEIKNRDKVGLIGQNGSGKTTLMRLFSGSERPDQGLLAVKKGARIGLLSQIPDYGSTKSVREVLLSAYDDLLALQDEMARMEADMASAGSDSPGRELERLLARYGQLQEQFERGGGYEMEANVDRVAAGLGIAAEQFSRPFSSLSGGEKTKIGLAVILLKQPDLLLLDEPTNHLDMAAIQWLEGFLREYSGTVVVISHDRYFLDAVARKIIELEDGEAFTYHCSYSQYKQEKEALLLQQFADYQEQQKKIKKMEESIKRLIEWGNRSVPPNPSFHRRAASMQKALDRMTKLKRPVLERKKIGLELQQQDRSGKLALVLKDVSKQFGDRALYSGVNQTLQYGESAALIGGNGSGKTTLLKSILGLEKVDSGEITIGSRVETGYLPQESAPQEAEQTVLRYFQDEAAMEAGEARGQLARFLFYGADVFKQVRNLSGGEWTRLRLAVLMHRRPNLLILDEPTNHLDIDSREALEEALEEYPGSVLAVSHDRYFINRIADRVWSLEQGTLHAYIGNYDDFRSEQEKLQAHKDTAVAAPSSTALAQEAVNRKAGNTSLERNANPVIMEDNRIDREAGTQICKPAATPSSLLKLEQTISAEESRVAEIDEAMQEPEAVLDAQRLVELQLERDQLTCRLDELYEKYFLLTDSSS
ncbi:ribosomal protection-like ABC-F family protein [Paenibacillus tuaregi]|uniref:ribosomal protection-like ABC-F family protein n=1 Tax=Paenibacillus tuaregi TaxID=1816681 RepID=UPI0008393E89|nr:ABC-F family ATP-binding cassette domain-containing protein [Paenibacillus tuaregi]